MFDHNNLRCGLYLCEVSSWHNNADWIVACKTLMSGLITVYILCTLCLLLFTCKDCPLNFVYKTTAYIASLVGLLKNPAEVTPQIVFVSLHLWVSYTYQFGTWLTCVTSIAETIFIYPNDVQKMDLGQEYLFDTVNITKLSHMGCLCTFPYVS